MSHSFSEAQTILERRFDVERCPPGSIAYDWFEGRLAELRAIADALGATHTQFESIQVAGTKGKGSVCLMLEAMLRASGYRVGTFLSPHLHSLRERFRIDGTLVSEEAFSDAVFALEDELAALAKRNPARAAGVAAMSFFDLMLLLATKLFDAAKTDIVLFEVGLGGRFDSTNICSPILSIITSISYDHILELGPTLAHIAAEKAGVIRHGVPVISGVRDDIAREVIRRHAEENHATLREWEVDFVASERDTAVSQTTFDYTALRPHADGSPSTQIEQLVLSCGGAHQVHNAAVAIDAALTLATRGWDRISTETLAAGLASVQLPARIEVLSRDPLLIVDGAHNRASVAALIATLERVECRGRKTLLFGTSLGKDVDGMLEELLPYFDRVFLTEHPNRDRAFPVQGLFTLAAMIRSDQSQEPPLFLFQNETGNAGDAASNLRDDDEDDAETLASGIFKALQSDKGLEGLDGNKSDPALAAKWLAHLKARETFRAAHESGTWGDSCGSSGSHRAGDGEAESGRGGDSGESDTSLISGIGAFLGASPATMGHCKKIEDCREAFRLAWETAQPGDLVCVTGSFYLAATIREIFVQH